MRVNSPSVKLAAIVLHGGAGPEISRTTTSPIGEALARVQLGPREAGDRQVLAGGAGGDRVALGGEGGDALLREQTDGALGSAVVLEVELAVAGDAERRQQGRGHRPLGHAALGGHVDLDARVRSTWAASVAA
jgi:hypothetical protein